MTTVPRVPPRGLLILLIGLTFGVGPFSIDMYLPSLPKMASDLDAAPSLMQLTITACLVGMGIGQIVAGPVSDARGRHRPLIAGTIAFIVFSFLCAIAPTVETLIGLRFLQGVAGAFGVVIGRAIVRDLYEGREAAALFSMLMIVNGLAPILAPLIGAGVLQVSSWRGVFIVLVGLGAVLLVAHMTLLGETLPREERRAGGLRETLRAFKLLLSDRTFAGCILASGFVSGAMFAYIAGAPFVLQDLYGASPVVFSVIFATNGLGIVLFGRISARLSRTLDPERILAFGVGTSVTGGFGVLLSVLAGLGLWGLLPSLFLMVSSVGLVFPNAAALALRGHRSLAGAASGLLGLTTFMVGGLVAPLVGVAGRGTAVPMAVVNAAAGTAALLTFLLLVRGRPSGPDEIELVG
ncbi:unannotated protein [freshwater metagenome]|uniref:Unannotated protein n=1 Tax=freshwater metagenome TaxID=449393 RepID=A0A6J7HXT7_9ZZZZ|nr:Bcr/CflA family efflux MFS transporter [Actinomycetota bacterium]